MIREDYVSFELAKMLKEKGFNIPCDYAYNNKAGYFETDRSNFDEVYCFRPSLAMAMKWLREVYNIHIMVQIGWFMGEYKWCADICKYKMVIPPTDAFDYIKDFKKDTYEEAVEAALKYCLTNIIK